MNVTRKRKLFTALITTAIALVVGGVFFVATFFFQNSEIEMPRRLANSSTGATAILITTTVLMWTTSHGVFDMLIFGVKSFALYVVGKRPEKDFYEYRTTKERINVMIIIGMAIGTAAWIIALIIFHVII